MRLCSQMLEPTLSAYALFAIVGALLADPRHLRSALCLLLLLNETIQHSLLLLQIDPPALLASPSSLTGRPLLSPQAGEATSAGSCGQSRRSEARAFLSSLTETPRPRASPSSLTEQQRVLALRGSEARASPSSLTEKQRVLVGLAAEAHKARGVFWGCSEEARCVSWGFYFEKSLRF